MAENKKRQYCGGRQHEAARLDKPLEPFSTVWKTDAGGRAIFSTLWNFFGWVFHTMENLCGRADCPDRAAMRFECETILSVFDEAGLLHFGQFVG